ncbi:hypothetical protein [Rhizobium sp. 1399]|uniref:hypothetical protein n=1 Tax=Rhizobium sp. 1399 TaxID=2817758 RepID=UPI00285456A6|nr:hypothetical protein [Rhizobium sp. 1399]MDR6670211.1 hypothetical protein [Rhizobium sp. 1399]
MAKSAPSQQKIKRAARERFLRQVRIVRRSLLPDSLDILAAFSSPQASADKDMARFELTDVAKVTDAGLSNAEATKSVLASMAAIEATLAKNPSNHLLQAYYAPTYHALRIELDRLTNLALDQSEAAYAPIGEILTATQQLQSLADRIEADTDKLNLANSVLGAIAKLITALGG